MRVIGLDIHRSLAEVAILDKGEIRYAGRVALGHDSVLQLGRSLSTSDAVVLEATRYDKQDSNFLASVKFAAIQIWIRFNESVT
jgi:hypothetical protein